MNTRTLATAALLAAMLTMSAASSALADGYDVQTSSGTVSNSPPPPAPPPPPQRPTSVAAVRG
jgi:hypothetical protein